MRGVGFAAVSASAVAAGIMASSSGSAMAAPTPCSTVRRERCFRADEHVDLLQYCGLLDYRGISPWARARGPW